jgi:hypothetical protein
MRGSSLGTIIDAVRLEAKMSTASSRGVEDRTRIVQMVNRVYETLWDEHDWEFLRIDREDSYKALAAGQRFYDFPTGLRPDDVGSAWLHWGTTWTRLEYGIDFRHYSMRNSEEDEREDPAQRWVVRSNTQFEVWPMPASNNAQTVGFEGKRSFVKLADDDADNCALDDQMITLFVAAEILAGNKMPDAEVKMEMARARLSALTARSADKTRVRVGLGGGALRDGDSHIRVAYARNQ